MRTGTYSRQLARLPGLQALLGQPVVHLGAGRSPRNAGVTSLAGWGLQPTTAMPRKIAQRENLPFISLEDGFLRSFGTGPAYPSLSLVVDDRGIYYAADRESALENLLEHGGDLLSGPGADYFQARQQILMFGLGKYNLAPDLASLPNVNNGPRVLVVDQTVGDSSVRYGLASAETFLHMLEAARAENPGATIYVKTHPEVAGGAKKGYLSGICGDARTVLLREPMAPSSLFKWMDRVYVVTSHMGFEALLHGRRVTCFGMPWYAGWGATDDRVHCRRRTRGRSVDELFSAAYLHYTRYLNPETLERGTIFDVIGWLTLQRRMRQAMDGRMIAIGYRRWKAENVRPFLGLDRRRVHFVPTATAAASLRPGPKDRLVVWGSSPTLEVIALAESSGAPLLRMEDGFVRSVGLGSDFVAPHALVMDSRGLYFDARQPHDLEVLLNTRAFTARDTERARAVRQLMVENALTKYNVEPTRAPSWRHAGRYVILVPGQVEDDASIRHGCGAVRDNLALLRAAREAHPEAFLVYKPHPDVGARNRKGKVHRRDALRYADHVETEVSIINCIDAADEVHTMTSLSGFDALLRGKSVVTYGMPFYAGWGLTTDHMPPRRRERQLDLDQLVAGAMLHYPTYWDWTLNGYATCEAALRRIISRRAELLRGEHPEPLRKTFLQRQFHKIKLGAKAKFLAAR
ncbi:capsular polysaccharide biosynthesis protein [Achromobacter sp. NPDC058515]|uniref:capsular polysaccharide biosynthesis protein n=1 Tax=Achromobacter sp. NPDC058515 TaxID=3346533 RepID=UPI00365A6A4A